LHRQFGPVYKLNAIADRRADRSGSDDDAGYIGIRPAGGEKGGPKRIMTPGEALKVGVDYMVVGAAGG
jgi:orotidine-5'-phosphate decarboxylase